MLAIHYLFRLFHCFSSTFNTCNSIRGNTLWLIGQTLNNNQITDINPLKELEQLTLLDLSGNQITDVTSIKELEQLTRLDLRGNQITDITPIKELE
ncbi:MAG: leucine-rich repeat domain-containing protein, partial [Bacteroidetes bacterium]|nr:leucine-rich repeat domain-containing protein [Bacteroidota bacterium]